MLAVTAAGFCAAEAGAQTFETSYFTYEGTRSVEEGGSVTITITSKNTHISRHLTYLTEQYTTWSPGSTEVAEAGIDWYYFEPKKLVVHPGRPETITIRTAEDYRVEHDEHFRLILRGTMVEEAGNKSYTTGLNITILNDDRSTLTVSDAKAVEGDALEFTATLSSFLHPGSVTMKPVFTNGTAGKADYIANTDPITFRAQHTPQTFRVSTTQDSVLEENETFKVGFNVRQFEVSWPYTGEGSAIAVVPGTGTIVDGTPTLTVGNTYASEGDSMTFTVTLDKAVSGGLTVTPSFTDDTATKGTDYTENTAALSFTGTAGETKTFTVATVEDTDAELTESFTVGLSVSGTQAAVRATDTGQGVIQDDDGDLAEVTIEDASADEGDSMTFTVTLDKAVSGGLTVTPRLAGGTTPGYATEGTDFTATTTPLSFLGRAGEKKSFTVATIQDSVAEADELFYVNLVVSEAQVPVTHLDFATGTIRDDEVRSLTVADASAVEGDSMTFTATLGKAVTGGLSTAVGHTDGTAEHGVDYRVHFDGPTFAGTAGETKTFTVATIGDDKEEEDETFTVSLHHTSGTQVATATGTIVDNDGPPSVTVSDASATEGDRMMFTLTLDKAVPLGLTVTPTFTDGTAKKGTDYTERGDSGIPFDGSAGATRTFYVSTTEDTDEEDDETFTVGLVVSGTDVTVTATDTATGTIVDDDGPAPALTVADASAEEGTALTFTVTLDKAVSGGLTVTPSFTDGTATKGTDYTENTAAVTFAGTEGETQSFTVSTAADIDDEDDETFTVGLAVSGTSETVTATDTATGTIIDDHADDADAPAVTIADARAAEGDSITFTLTLDKAVSGGLTVTPSFTDGTATKGADYTENTAAISFTGTEGETKTLTVSTIEDADDENDETFIVSLAVAGPSRTVTATDTATGTITDDDGAPTAPAVTIADASAAEGEALTFTLTLDKAVAGGLTVTPSFTDGTATKGTDYTENTAAISFAGSAGETKTLTVSTTEDTDDENDETFTVSFAVSGTTQTVTATDTATGTITDDDGDDGGASAAAVTVSDASAAEGDPMTFTVTLDKAVSGGLTVTPSFRDGSATKGTDYRENTRALSFAGTAGETKSFTVATTADSNEEPNETFTVSLTVSGTTATVTATDTATGTILDDDTPAVLTIGDASGGEGDPIVFTVKLDRAVPGGLTVTPSFTDGTATKGTDYTENTAALTFAGTAGERKTFTVATSDDTGDEPDETFTVSLTVSGTTATVTATDTATGTILDDDTPAVLTIGDASAGEGDPLVFTLMLDRKVPGGLTATPGFTGGTATQGADYVASTAPVFFAGYAGETRALTVTTTDDSDEEEDETLTVGLTVSGTSMTVTATDTAGGTIIDDDEGGDDEGAGAAPALTVTGAAADEGEPLAFVVTLDQAVSGGLTVTPTFTDGTASQETDYTPDATPLRFAGTAGETQTLTVATTDDTDEEPNETFTVGLTVSGTSETVTATDTATGTIIDNDEHRPAAALTIAGAAADEGEPLAFVVTLDDAVTGGLTVTPTFTDGTASQDADYTPDATPLRFAGTAGETQTLTVATTDDDDEEPHETFTVGLTVSGTPETVTATDTATGTIIDDDGDDERGPAPAVTIADASAGEGDPLTLTVTLDKAVPGGLTVTPTFTDGTATEGSDYTANTAPLPFTGRAGEARTFTVATIEDRDEEPNERFTIGLSVSGTETSVTAADTARATIIDDDAAQAELTIGDAIALEGDHITFAITLDGEVPEGFTVTPDLEDETATAGEDYRAARPPVRFAGRAGETQTFTVPTIEDAVEEDDETFTVSLRVSGTTSPVTVTDTATGRIADDDLTPVVLRVEPARVAETAGPTTVRVTAALDGGTPLSRATAVGVTVGAANDTAEAGADYTASPASFTVTIPAGATEASVTFTLGPVNDTLMEPDEILTVDGDSGSRAVTAAAVTLEDDDTSAARLVVRMEPDSVSESAGPTEVTIVAEITGGRPTAPLPVTMRIGDDGDTAQLALDYQAIEAFTVTIPAGETEQRATFLLSPVEDELIEGNETLTVTGEAARLDAASDEGVIRDADLAEVRSEGTGRTLFLLARAIGSESLAAIEERFSSAGLGRRARLGAVPSLGPGAPGAWGGPFAGAGMLGGPGLGMPGGGGPHMPGVAGVGAAAPLAGPAGSPAPFGHGPGAFGMGLGMSAHRQPFEELAWLDGAGFTAPLAGSPGGTNAPAGPASGDPAGWVVWGRAATTRTAVQATPGAQARGDLFTVHLGVDTRVGSRLLVGVAASHSRGKLGYTLGGQADAVPAAVDGDLTSAQPYLQWTPRAGLEVWGSGGAGRGALRVVDTFGTVDTGLGMRMAAGGARQEVTAGGGLAVKADVFHVAVASDAHLDLPEARATATRARVLLEWESEWAPSNAARVRPRLEVGGRWDGGSDVDGFGSEVGGGIALAHVGLGLELSGSGRYLLAHQAKGFEEWGASLALRAGPGVTRRGAWVSLEPEWGAAASRMHAMWGQQADPGLHPGASLGALGAEPARLRLAAGYALPEAGTDLRVEAMRETYDPQSGPSVGVRFSAQIGW